MVQKEAQIFLRGSNLGFLESAGQYLAPATHG